VGQNFDQLFLAVWQLTIRFQPLRYILTCSWPG